VAWRGGWRLATCFVVLALACRGLVVAWWWWVGRVPTDRATEEEEKKNGALLVQEWRRNSEAEDAAHAVCIYILSLI
jgi:hypothetical protein